MYIFRRKWNIIITPTDNNIMNEIQYNTYQKLIRQRNSIRNNNSHWIAYNILDIKSTWSNDFIGKTLKFKTDLDFPSISYYTIVPKSEIFILIFLLLFLRLLFELFGVGHSSPLLSYSPIYE